MLNFSKTDLDSRPRVMRGLIAAPYTPFDRHSGDIKLDVIERYAQSLVDAGVTGAFVCGTTGEGVSLTMEERMAVAQRWTEVAGDRLKVIVHVGDLCQRNAAALAAHARRINAAAVAAMPTFFFKPSGAAAVADFCKPIAQAAGELPFFYYHIPSMNGVTVSVVELLGLAEKQIPNLLGVKFTHPDLMEFQRCQSTFGDRFELAWGVDEILLGALAIGATAAVGSTYNYATPLYRKMINAHRDGDLETARRASRQVCEMVAVLLKYGVLRTGKASMAMIGIDCGPPRSPIAPLTREEISAVRAEYELLGVLPSTHGESDRASMTTAAGANGTARPSKAV